MIDIIKKYRTRDGREVRIYATDGHEYPIHGAVMDRGWCVHYWDADGRGQLQRFDLIEIKQRIKQKVWVNVYPDHCLGAYHEKRQADEQAMPHRIGCVQVEIDCEEGEGL
jgi:hypothetical protein